MFYIIISIFRSDMILLECFEFVDLSAHVAHARDRQSFGLHRLRIKSYYMLIMVRRTLPALRIFITKKRIMLRLLCLLQQIKKFFFNYLRGRANCGIAQKALHAKHKT